MTSCFDETLTAKDSTQESQRVRSDIALKMVVGEGAAPPGSLIWRFPGL